MVTTENVTELAPARTLGETHGVVIEVAPADDQRRREARIAIGIARRFMTRDLTGHPDRPWPTARRGEANGARVDPIPRSVV